MKSKTKQKYIVKCQGCKLPYRRTGAHTFKCSSCRGEGRPLGWGSISRKLRKVHPYCSICGRTDNQVLLHVDHIDKNKFNHDLSNLRVLCIQCHISLHRNEDKDLVGVHYQLHGIRLLYKKNDYLPLLALGSNQLLTTEVLQS